MNYKHSIKWISLLHCILFCHCVIAQNAIEKKIDIKGHVTGKDGKPLQGASIAVKNTKVGTTTNADGNFSMSRVSAQAIIMISYTGYQPVETYLNGKSQIHITLDPSVELLDQPIVIGYGTTSRRRNTGSVSKISASIIERQPIGNPLAAMQGRMTGVQVTQNNGVPGGAYSIQIRGKNSLRSDGNDPLYIIDGVPFTSSSTASGNIFGANRTPTVLANPLNNISTQDIESIEVLKDADATAIYGSRGANGVVLITTKKGRSGDVQIEANVYGGYSSLKRRIALLNTEQYLAMRKEAFANDGATPTTNNFREYYRWDTSRYTDWQDVLLGNKARLYNLQLSMFGGKQKTQFRISGGVRKETTVFPGDNSNTKMNFSFNIQHRSDNEKFNATFSGSYVVDNSQLPSTDLTYSALTLPPNAPALYDINGNLNWENSTWTNPLSYLMQQYGLKNNNLISNGILSYNILSNLQIKTSFGLNRLTTSEFSTTPLSSFSPSSRPRFVATSVFNNTILDSWIIEPQMNYNLSIGKNRLAFLAGGTFQQNIRELEVLTARNFSNESLMQNIKAASSIEATATDNSVYRFNSIFGRINYEINNTVFVNLSSRQDRSSRFGPGKKNAIFYAVGTSWIFSELKQLKHSHVLSFGKLRSSYGTTGSDAIGDYNYLETYEPTTDAYLNIRGLSPVQLGNSNYGWELNKKFEAAVELGFLGNKILLTAGYFSNRSSNQLVGYALPPTTGFTSITSNFPAVVRNTGIELQLNADLMKVKHFSWEISANMTVPRNKLVTFPNIANTSYGSTYIVGKSLYIQNKYHYAGVDPQSGRNSFEDVSTGNPTFTPTLDKDLQGLQSIEPKLYGGLQNTLNYKGISFSIFFQFTKQNGFNYLYTLARGFNAPGMLGNQPTTVLNRWQKPGDITGIQKFTQSFGEVYESYATAQYSSDQTISDASFIRLKNISLSYQFSETHIKKALLRSATVFMQGQNLLTWTNYKGLDPESQLITTLPPLTTITFGVKFSL